MRRRLPHSRTLFVGFAWSALACVSVVARNWRDWTTPNERIGVTAAGDTLWLNPIAMDHDRQRFHLWLTRGDGAPERHSMFVTFDCGLGTRREGGFTPEARPLYHIARLHACGVVRHGSPEAAAAARTAEIARRGGAPYDLAADPVAQRYGVTPDPAAAPVAP